jgi:hypothetical protein
VPEGRPLGPPTPTPVLICAHAGSLPPQCYLVLPLATYAISESSKLPETCLTVPAAQSRSFPESRGSAILEFNSLHFVAPKLRVMLIVSMKTPNPSYLFQPLLFSFDIFLPALSSIVVLRSLAPRASASHKHMFLKLLLARVSKP